MRLFYDWMFYDAAKNMHHEPCQVIHILEAQNGWKRIDSGIQNMFYLKSFIKRQSIHQLDSLSNPTSIGRISLAA